jgi:hypothetical protein
LSDTSGRSGNASTPIESPPIRLEDAAPQLSPQRRTRVGRRRVAPVPRIAARCLSPRFDYDFTRLALPGGRCAVAIYAASIMLHRHGARSVGGLRRAAPRLPDAWHQSRCEVTRPDGGNSAASGTGPATQRRTAPCSPPTQRTNLSPRRMQEV